MRSYIMEQLNLRNDRFLQGVYFEAKHSYSQCGEDLIIDFIFSALGIANGRYLDIGSHHPFYLNNTFIFYRKGWRGVNVEPIEERLELFKIQRSEDTNICAGVGGANETKEFYIMEAEALSTFDFETYAAYEKIGHALKEKRNIQFIDVKSLLEDAKIDKLDLLSVDIEGDDKVIVGDIIKHGVRPKVIVCESVFYSKKLDLRQKNTEAIKSIEALGYKVYADTFVNTIFLDADIST